MLKQKDVCAHARARERGSPRGTVRASPARERSAQLAPPGQLKRPLGRGHENHSQPRPPHLHQPEHRPAAQDAAELERLHPPWT